MTDPTERFSTRVADYVRYRPGYPSEIIDSLRSECGLSEASIIADIGSGTGKLAELFLRNGNQVFAVEPNLLMRIAGEQLLGDYSRFTSIDGSAESTGLPDGSIDFVTAGQSFHWFDRKKARTEFKRILKRGGWVAVIWNERRLNSTPFLQAYEELLLKYGTDYKEVRHENTSAEIGSFFAPYAVISRTFETFQEFEFEGLKGRVASSSYTPERGTPEYVGMMVTLREIFDHYSQSGRVVFEYDTRVYAGQL